MESVSVGQEYARLRAPQTFASFLSRRGCHCNDSPLHQAGSPRPHRATPRDEGAAQRVVAQAAAEEGARWPLTAGALACHRNSVHLRLRGRQPRQSSHDLKNALQSLYAEETSDVNLRLRANRALAGDRVSDRILHRPQHYAQVACRLPADPKAAQRREEIKPSQPSAASSVQRQWRGALGSARFTGQSRRRRQANPQWSQSHGQGRGDTCNYGYQRLREEHVVQSSCAHPSLQSPLAALPPVLAYSAQTDSGAMVVDPAKHPA